MWTNQTGRIIAAILLIVMPGLAQAQPDTLLLSKRQAENIFLEHNISLLAEKLNIRQADARILQARLWPNPNLSIDEVNLWATPAQLTMGDGLPPLFRNGTGKNQQLAAQLEQVIITAGKRRKLIAMEQVSRDMAVSYFKDLLRNLKIEFRNMLTELQYLQLYQSVFVKQITETQLLVTAYERQAEIGNINRADIIRLKALSLELNNQHNELRREINRIQKELTIMMSIPEQAYIKLTTEDFVPDAAIVDKLSLEALTIKARAARPDLISAQQESSYARSTLSYEKSRRMPDLTLSAGYDRGSNFMYNFVGFGLGMDLPVFNRNQGNIKVARIGLEKAGLLEDNKTRMVTAEVKEAYLNTIAASDFFRRIDPGYENELDQMLRAYTSSFRNRHVSILEFLDFMEAYLDNKKTILNAKKSLSQTIEELKYSVGTELN